MVDLDRARFRKAKREFLEAWEYIMVKDDTWIDPPKLLSYAGGLRLVFGNDEHRLEISVSPHMAVHWAVALAMTFLGKSTSITDGRDPELLIKLPGASYTVWARDALHAARRAYIGASD